MPGPFRVIVVVAVLLAVSAAASPLSLAGEPGANRGLKYPGRTDAGEWSGTWFYQNRSEHWAMWLREVDGVPQIRLQYFNLDRGEQFETDWDGAATYAHRDRKGAFRLTPSERNANLIEADWFWELGDPERDSNSRTETAKITMYRAGEGRQLVVRFHNFERVHREGGNTFRIDEDPAWTFRKISRRQARWQELPF